MGLRASLKSRLQDWSARAGYPIIPNWRLAKYDQSAHLGRLFHALGIDCVLDVGANIGQFHEFLRLHVGYRGRVVSFEPVPELFARLEAASRQDPAWTVHPCALGEVETAAAIHVLEENTLTSFLPRDEAALLAMGYDKYLKETTLARDETVRVRRLDRVFDEVVGRHDARVFLKSDTQGYDMHVIRGAAGCLDRIAALQVELSVRHVYQGAPHYLDAIAELNGLGFELTGLYAVQRDSALRVVNLDCTMIRADEARKLREARASYGN
jgi:FkbM family methyltransferase